MWRSLNALLPLLACSSVAVADERSLYFRCEAGSEVLQIDEVGPAIGLLPEYGFHSDGREKREGGKLGLKYLAPKSTETLESDGADGALFIGEGDGYKQLRFVKEKTSYIAFETFNNGSASRIGFVIMDGHTVVSKHICLNVSGFRDSLFSSIDDYHIRADSSAWLKSWEK